MPTMQAKTFTPEPIAVIDEDAEERRMKQSSVPVALDHIFMRLDIYLRNHLDHALVATELPKKSAMELSRFTVMEVELKDNGRVKIIDLEKRARELGLLYDFEVPLAHWQASPRS